MISIIITNYNGLKWLKKCLDSLFSQTYNDFEIILVDNGSTDDSIKFLEENYKDERLKIVRSEKNLGFAGGNNLGFNNSKGEYILLLNNDTWVENDFLEIFFNFYIKNTFDAIGCEQRDYYSQKSFKNITYCCVDIFGFPVNVNGNFGISGYCMLFSRDVYLETKGLDNNFFMYYEDVDWFWRLNLLNKKVFVNRDIYLYHAGGGSSGEFKGLNYNIFLWRNQNSLQLLLKNYSWYNLLWILLIYFLQNIFEIIFFLFTFRFRIAFSYIEGWIFNIKNINRILEKRKWVQKNRVINDREMFKNLYFGSAKFFALISYIKINYGKRK